MRTGDGGVEDGSYDSDHDDGDDDLFMWALYSTLVVNR